MSILTRRGVGARVTLVAIVALVASSLSSWGTPASAAITTVVINEVESSGGSPGDWAELHNTGATAVDISGLKFLDNVDNDATHVYTIPAGTVIAAGGYFVLEEAALTYGLGSADSARLFEADGTTLIDTYTWATHGAPTYGRCPNGTGAFTNTVSSTKGAANDCGGATTTTTTGSTTSTTAGAALTVAINEVESNGGTPDDWVELYNTGAATIDISGLKFIDNDDTHALYAIPAGTTLAPGGYYVLESGAFGFGLGGADSARLFAADGTTLLTSYSWTAHATATTYGRCPNGTGAFVTTGSSTKAAANDCGVGTTSTTAGSSAAVWPGSPTVQTVDNTATFTSNLSGLVYEGSGSATPGVLWAARNGAGALFRLVYDGSAWVPDTADGWGAGKGLRYPDGGGDADAESVTMGGTTSASGLYVSAERNNTANSVSRNSILRYDPSAPGSTLTATNEWNLTADLPTTGANLGLEAITWVPDSYLVANGFVDQAQGHVYDPAEYPNHGSGLFVVGLESSGSLFVYALDHVGGGFTRVATLASGLPAVMALEFDRDLNDLWALCDDTCNGRSSVLRLTSATGTFISSSLFERPTGMANINNEGFAIASATECVDDRKPVYWSDDSDTGGYSLRRGTLPCTAIPLAEVPSLPLGPLSLIPLALLIGAWAVYRQRRAGMRLAS